MVDAKMPQQRAQWWYVLGLWLCSGCAMLGPVYVWAFDNAESRATLRGVTGFEVGVGEVRPEVARAGVTPEVVRQEVIRRLRRAGITLLSREELLQRPDAAFFAVSVGAIRHPAGMLYAYSIDVGIYQAVTLTRDPAIALSLPTWSNASFGLVSHANLRGLLPSVGARVAAFIKVYRMVNPQQTPASARTTTSRHNQNKRR